MAPKKQPKPPHVPRPAIVACKDCGTFGDIDSAAMVKDAVKIFTFYCLICGEKRGILKA